MGKLQLFIFTNFILFNTVFSQQRSLDFYQNKAHENNPALKENLNLQKINIAQGNLTLTQLTKPQINFTADYLFAPYFFNNKKIISVTPNPDTKAFGYDIAASNGGWYAAQLNAAVPLFTGNLIKAFNFQYSNQNQLYKYNNKQLLHDLDKLISDNYISAFQVQEQIEAQKRIIEIVESRKEIVSALALKGLMQQNDFLLLEIDIKQRQNLIYQQQIILMSYFNQLNSLAGIFDTMSYTLENPIVKISPMIKEYNFEQKFKLDKSSIAAQEQIFNTKYLPQIMAYGNSGLNSTYAATIIHNFGISAGLHLAIPIYDGGQKKIIQQQNTLLVESLKNYQDQYKTNTANNLALLIQQIGITEQSINMLQSQLLTQETLLKIVKDKVVLGQFSVTDYLNALQDYATTNQNKIQYQSNLWLLINQYNYINW